MNIKDIDYLVNGISYTVRSAILEDAKELSEVRLRIDGETEYLDREPGEAFIDPPGFELLIKADTENSSNLFLVAVVHDRIAGFSRCEGSPLKRCSHKVEFGVCVRQEFWGLGIGKNLLRESIAWADAHDIHKISLGVLETNEKAIRLYKKFGFELEGILRKDKILSDGKYYSTMLMGRIRE